MREVDLTHDNLKLQGLARNVLIGGLVVGVAGLALSGLLALMSEDGWSRFLHSYLVSFCYFLTVALGGLFFVLVQHLMRAGWSVVVRRIAEALSTNLLLLGVLAIPILLGLGELYHWAEPGAADHDPLIAHKAAFLDPTFFTVRVVIYFVVWAGLAWYYFGRSVAQDDSGDHRITLSMQKWSGPGVAAFALTGSLAGFDLLMSLDPHWYSTMFGVYFFAGCMVAILAVLPLIVALLQSTGRMVHAVTPEHYHDLGKLLFGFVVFWAYIAFFQFMLIWYANIPEETAWYMLRMNDGWTLPALTLLIGHFALPFAFLMSRWVKRNRVLLAFAAAWVLLMHWVDLYWLVLPPTSPIRIPLHLLDLTTLVGIGGLFVATTAWTMRNRALVPRKDPRLDESLAFENV